MTDPRGLKAVLPIEGLGNIIGDPYLKGQPARIDVVRYLRQGHQQQLAQASPTVLGPYGDGSDMRLVDHQPEAGVTGEVLLARGGGGQFARAMEREDLAPEAATLLRSCRRLGLRRGVGGNLPLVHAQHHVTRVSVLAQLPLVGAARPGVVGNESIALDGHHLGHLVHGHLLDAEGHRRCSSSSCHSRWLREGW